MKELTDSELLERYAAGGAAAEAAFAEIVRRHGALVYAACRRQLGETGAAEDAVQAVFMLLARKARTLARKEALAGWLYGAASLVAREHLRAARRRKSAEKEAAEMRKATGGAPARDWSELRPELDAALGALPRHYRDAVVLSCLEGKPEAEVARELAVPAGTVKSRVSRGLEALRERLGQRGTVTSAAALVGLFGAHGAEAMPAALAAKVAGLGAFGTAAIAGAGLPAVALAKAGSTSFAMMEGAMKAMFWMKVKFAAAVIGAVVVVGGGGGAVAVRLAAGEPKADPVKAEAPAPEKPAPAEAGKAAWYTALTANEWVDLAKVVPGGATNLPDPTCTAYSGGCVNTVGVYEDKTFIPGTFIICFGGGHGDGSDDSVFAFGPLAADKPIWRRLSQNRKLMNVYFDADGYPVASHTYDSLVFVPEKNWMLVTGCGSRFSDSSGNPDAVTGNTSARAYVFDFTVVSPMTNNPWRLAPNNTGSATCALSGYDPVAKVAWNVRNSARLMKFVPGKSVAESKWVDHGLIGPVTDSANADVHPVDQLMLIQEGASLFGMDLRGPKVRFAIKPSGTGPANSSDVSICWAGTKWAVYRADGGKTVFFLEHPANPYVGTGWTWTSMTPAGGIAPAKGNGSGVFGRFGYIDKPKGLFYISTSGPLYFWKLP